MKDFVLAVWFKVIPCCYLDRLEGIARISSIIRLPRRTREFIFRQIWRLDRKSLKRNTSLDERLQLIAGIAVLSKEILSHSLGVRILHVPKILQKRFVIKKKAFLQSRQYGGRMREFHHYFFHFFNGQFEFRCVWLVDLVLISDMRPQGVLMRVEDIINSTMQSLPELVQFPHIYIFFEILSV